MRPGTEHIVLTLENSIVLGSHFLSDVTLLRSMCTGLHEHYWGATGTNTQHLGSEVILYRILALYQEKLENTGAIHGETFIEKVGSFTDLEYRPASTC